MAGTITNPTTIDTPDNQTFVNNVFGRAGEQISADLHGRYYTQTYRGEMFYATTVAATAPALYTATGVTSMGIWNPANSGKNLVISRMVLGPVTAASAACMVGYAIVTNAGSAVATAAPISSFTALSSSLRGSGLVGTPSTSVALVCTGATVIAPTQFIPAFGWTTDVITTSSEGNAFIDETEGKIIVPPGTAIFVASSVANTGTANYGLWWYEAPL